MSGFFQIATIYTPAMDNLIFIFKPMFYQRPAIIYDKESQNIVVFAERRSGSSEESPGKLVMKKGLLKKTLAKLALEWKVCIIVKEARLEGHRVMKPCPVYDKKKKKLFLFFTCVYGTCTEQWQKDNHCNKTRLCYVTSENLGEDWSEVTDLTNCLPEHCVTFGIGPGHGLQTEDGRLIVPAYVYTGVSPNKPVPHALALFSDDCGASWQFGDMVPKQSVECQMAEVYGDNGRLIYCNARDEGGHRVEAFSDNNGNTFTVSADEKSVNTSSSCQGSVISFPSQYAAESDETTIPKKWLLFSHPTSSSGRSGLGVYVKESPFGSTAWSQPWVITEGPSENSDLVHIDGDWFACLFECGNEKESEQIALRFFQFMDIKPTPKDKMACRVF